MPEVSARQVSFDWPPFYRELATKLLPYRNRQAELLALLDKLRAQDIPVTPCTDMDAQGRKFPLEEMDPFTFYGTFNRGVMKKVRLAILGAMKEKLSDLRGIQQVALRRITTRRAGSLGLILLLSVSGTCYPC